MSLRHWLVLLIAAVGWGAGGVFTRAAFAEGMSPVEFSVYRPAVAALLVAAYLLVTGRRIPRRAHMWRAGLVLGTVNLAAPFLLLTFAVVHASAGFVGLLVANIPLATAVWAHLLKTERLDRRKLLGLGISFGGILVLLVTGDSGLDEGGNAALAIGLSIAALSLVSFGINFAKRALGAIDPTSLALPQFTIGATVLALILPFSDGLPEGISLTGWILVFAAASGSTVVPFLLFYAAMRHVTATQASLTGYLIPIVAVMLGAVWLGERVSAAIVVAGGLILTGIVVTDRASIRPPAHTPGLLSTE